MAVTTTEISNTDAYYLEKMNSIRESLKCGIFPPVFTKRNWKHLHLSSYAYALNITVDDPAEKLWIPGCVCNQYAEKSIYLLKDLLIRFKMDLHFLGFSCRKDDGNSLREGEWRIAIYSEPTYYKYPQKYYFCRQDANGYWSIKKNWIGSARRIHSKLPPLKLMSNLILETVLIVSKNSKN